MSRSRDYTDLLHLFTESDRGLPGWFAPVPKVVCTITYLVLMVSFSRYDAAGTCLYALIPYIMASCCGISFQVLFKRALIALPLVLCAGVANCFFDHTPITIWNGFVLSGGLFSLIVLIAKTFGTVGIVILLALTTPLSEISGALTSLKVPCILVLQIQLLFRYLLLTLEEARNLTTAYFLRSPNRQIIPISDWGPLIGQLFVRSVLRGEEVYQAMQCRLFRATTPIPAAHVATCRDWMTATVFIALCTVMRYYL